MAVRSITLSLLLFTSTVYAIDATPSPTAETYAYPELLVTPKATERLASESKNESSSAWVAHIPVQASALVTLYASTVAAQDHDPKTKKVSTNAKNASQVGMLVGGGWLLTTVGMSALYRPYRSCFTQIPKLNSKSQAAVLARERAAEECISAPARLASRINFLSALSNVAAGAFIVSSANEDYTKALGGISILAAFAPYLFSYEWQTVADYHQDYKRRIYGPITSIEIGPMIIAKQKLPGLGLSVQW